MTSTLSDHIVNRLAKPITQEQATAAILRLVRSPLVGNIDGSATCGEALLHIHDGPYHQLSAGEQRLVDIACNIWSGREDLGARIAAIAGLDLDTRRKVLIVLTCYFLGDDKPLLLVTGREFDELFIGAES